jgi:peptidoglycan/LPS O-acetylase OafA/YrhL
MAYTYRCFGAFRLLLAALVVFQHFSADLAPDSFAYRLLPYEFGGVAVLVFFALSGFVITEAVDQIYWNKPLGFLTNRLLRIMPHFIAAVALSIVLHYLAWEVGTQRLWRSQLSFPFETAFSLRNILLNFIDVLPLSEHSMEYEFLDIVWAVRVEMAFYLVVFFLLIASRVWPGRSSLGLAFGAVLMPISAIFVLAMYGKSPGTFTFVPYFAFGAALYFAVQGARAGFCVAVISLPAMVWQYIAARTANPLLSADERAVATDLVVLALLLSLMMVLARGRITSFRSIDAYCGNLSYPVYLYHQNVLLALLIITTGYSYSTFVLGMLLSALIAVVAHACIDPLVNKYRDRVRGRRVDVGHASQLTAIDLAIVTRDAR